MKTLIIRKPLICPVKLLVVIVFSFFQFYCGGDSGTTTPINQPPSVNKTEVADAIRSARVAMDALGKARQAFVIVPFRSNNARSGDCYDHQTNDLSIRICFGSSGNWSLTATGVFTINSVTYTMHLEEVVNGSCNQSSCRSNATIRISLDGSDSSRYDFDGDADVSIQLSNYCMDMDMGGEWSYRFSDGRSMNGSVDGELRSCGGDVSGEWQYRVNYQSVTIEYSVNFDSSSGTGKVYLNGEEVATIRVYGQCFEVTYRDGSTETFC
ncbi:MAG: hypothetical protein LC778_16885 [Acidobacteria bacterium]|nr:hypothetical protein [Acidobacteriota bacterium]